MATNTDWPANERRHLTYFSISPAVRAGTAYAVPDCDDDGGDDVRSNRVRVLRGGASVPADLLQPRRTSVQWLPRRHSLLPPRNREWRNGDCASGRSGCWRSSCHCRRYSHFHLPPVLGCPPGPADRDPMCRTWSPWWPLRGTAPRVGWVFRWEKPLESPETESSWLMFGLQGSLMKSDADPRNLEGIGTDIRRWLEGV